MQNIEIKLSGITRHASEESGQNGEMEDCINLDNVAGEIIPMYPPRKSTNISAGDSLVYVHYREGNEFRFYYNTSTGLTIKKLTSKGNALTLDAEENVVTIASITGDVNGIESVGNTVIISSTGEVGGGINYLLYKNGTYILLGNSIPYPIIQPNISTVMINHANDYGMFDGTGIINAILDTYSVDDATRESGMKKLPDLINTGVIKQIAANSEAGKFTFPFFVRYAIRLYDGTLTKHSPPFLMVPSPYANANGKDDAKFKIGKMSYTNMYDSITSSAVLILAFNSFKLSHEMVSGTLNYVISGIIDDLMPGIEMSNWSDVISSIDIFISKPQYTVDINGKGYLNKSEVETVAGITNETGMVEFPMIDKKGVIASLSNESVYYMLESIPIDKVASYSFTPANVSGNKLNTIVNQEIMTDDYISHNSLFAQNINSYNARISLSGASQDVFKGFYAGAWTRVAGKNLLKHSTGHSPVGAFVYHPDKRATEVLDVGLQVALKPHSSLNGAYYLNPTLEPIPITAGVTLPATPELLIDDLSEKLITSDVNNPFLFRPSGIITFQGIVVGTATTTEPLSQGQFGQFPLYVLTSKGVWALEISNSGEFSSKQIITREVCINKDSIIQLKREVAFMTQKGLCIISGSDTEVITSILEDSRYAYPVLDITNLTTKANVSSILELVNNEPTFAAYMLNARPAYDPVNDRIYLYNPEYKYSYVFNVISRMWTKQELQILKSVNNYPSLYFQLTDGIYEPTLDSIKPVGAIDKEVNVFFVTRPIKFETVNYLIQQLKLKGVITFNHPAETPQHSNVLALYASRDGVHYNNVGASATNILALRGSAYKFYKIAYAGKLNPTDSIGDITLNIITKYTNKLR